jgi:hypothetical protein
MTPFNSSVIFAFGKGNMIKDHTRRAAGEAIRLNSLPFKSLHGGSRLISLSRGEPGKGKKIQG